MIYHLLSWILCFASNKCLLCLQLAWICQNGHDNHCAFSKFYSLMLFIMILRLCMDFMVCYTLSKNDLCTFIVSASFAHFLLLKYIKGSYRIFNLCLAWMTLRIQNLKNLIILLSFLSWSLFLPNIWSLISPSSVPFLYNLGAKNFLH